MSKYAVFSHKGGVRILADKPPKFLRLLIYGMPKDNNIIHAHTRGYAKRAADRAALFVYTCYPMKERVGFPIAIYVGSPKKSVTFLGERRH